MTHTWIPLIQTNTPSEPTAMYDIIMTSSHWTCSTDLGLKVIDELSDVFDEKRPRVDEEDPIHHHNNETVPVKGEENTFNAER